MQLNPAVLAHVQDIAAMVRDDLGDDADDQVLADCIEGETDAMAILDALLRHERQDASHVAALKAEKDRLALRQKRIEARVRAARSMILAILEAAGIKKAERPLATVSIMAGRVSVDVYDKAKVPTQLRKPGDPDVTAIRSLLDAGEDVPGARLVTGDNTVRIA